MSSPQCKEIGAASCPRRPPTDVILDQFEPVLRREAVKPNDIRQVNHTGLDIGLILTGKAGVERQFARNQQLYSCIGFAHQYRPTDPEVITAMLSHYWEQLGCIYIPTDPADADTAEVIASMTGGKFRLIERHMTEMARVMTINQPQTIVPGVVHQAFQVLVVGTAQPDIVAKLLQIGISQRRRTSRPVGELRAATGGWTEFEDYFGSAKVALGDCHRPFGGPCVHEHARTRCPFLVVDPAQIGRVDAMTANAQARLVEAR